MEKAQHDMREFDRLTKEPYRSAILFWILCAVFVCLGAAGWFALQLPAAAAADVPAALACAAVAVLNAKHNKKREAGLDAAQALLERYENHSG